MARFPDKNAFGPSPSAALENLDASYDAPISADEGPSRDQLERASADIDYIVRTGRIRSELSNETDPDGLTEKYEAQIRQVHSESAAQISNPQQRESWLRERMPDAKGHVDAAADYTSGLIRAGEISKADTQLQEALQAGALSNDLINGLHAAGHVSETQARERQRAWAENFALTVFSKLPAAEQAERIRAKLSEEDASGKDDLIAFVPQERLPDMLRSAESRVSLERRNVEGLITADLVSIRQSGKGGRALSPERVQTALGPETARKWQEAREDHQAIWKFSSDLYALPEEELKERLRSLAPQKGELTDFRKAAVYFAVQEAADEIRRLRFVDPAKSVDDDPTVRAARDYQGEPNDPQAPRNLYAARLAAQERAGIARDAQSPITKEEALALTAPLRGKFSSQEDRDHAWQALAAEFKQKFGNDAEIALFYAFGTHVAEVTTKFMSARFSRRENGPDVGTLAVEPSHSPMTIGLNDMGEAPNYPLGVPKRKNRSQLRANTSSRRILGVQATKVPRYPRAPMKTAMTILMNRYRRKRSRRFATIQSWRLNSIANTTGATRRGMPTAIKISSISLMAKQMPVNQISKSAFS